MANWRIAQINLLLVLVAMGAGVTASVGLAQSANGQTQQSSVNTASDRASDDVPVVLFLTQSLGYEHQSVRRADARRSPAELAMMQLAKDSGMFKVVCSQRADVDFRPEVLEKFDIVAFYTSGDLPIEKATFDYFLTEWLPQRGKGVLGFHSATDTFKEFEPYWDLMGGTFAGHPWGANAQVSLRIHDTSHPAIKPFGDTTFRIQDEIYQYSNWQPEKVRVLMSLDMGETELKRPYHVPVSWCKEIGEGRLFYNNLGHRQETWKNEAFLASIVAAIRWIDYQTPGSATPNPAVSKRHADRSKQQAEAAANTPTAIKDQDAAN